MLPMNAIMDAQCIACAYNSLADYLFGKSLLLCKFMALLMVNIERKH
jgi:hypothetical protein